MCIAADCRLTQRISWRARHSSHPCVELRASRGEANLLLCVLKVDCCLHSESWCCTSYLAFHPQIY
ncbi:UNVERIFIED_CONTAM: hypothetical protein FKN15_044335 [Acipenser sinensis]